MILPNMSYQEIATHLSSDMDEALAFSKKIKFARYRSEAIKLKRYPLFFKPVGFTSSQHNKWFIFPHVRNRADLVSIPFYVGCTFTKYNRLCLFIQRGKLLTQIHIHKQVLREICRPKRHNWFFNSRRDCLFFHQRAWTTRT